MPFAPLRDGDQLYFETHGDGFPVVFAAGLGGLGSFWRSQVPRFMRRFMVITYDHRGTGRSSRSTGPYSIDQMADDVVDLLEAAGASKAHFVGHSTGGAVGQALAIDHRERIGRLVLSATWAAADAYMRSLFELRAEVLCGLGMESHRRLSLLLLRSPRWFRDHPEDLETTPFSSDPADRDILLSRIDALLGFDRRAALGAVAAPALVLCAEDDIVVPPYLSEELGRSLPNARTVILPRGGHCFPQTMEQRFGEEVEAFLTGETSAT